MRNSLFGLLLFFLLPGCLPTPPAEPSSVWVSVLVRPVESGACLAKNVLIIDDQQEPHQIEEAPGETVCNQGIVELPPGRTFTRVFVVSDLALVEVEIFTP